MNNYADYHTHTHFSDGKQSIDEMAQFAFENGMYAIGFSDHSPMHFEEARWKVRDEWLKDIIKSVGKLKKEYAGKLDIFAGLELDLHSDMCIDGLDYIIASCHYMKVGDEYAAIDYSSEVMMKDAYKYFGGDLYKYCRHYYEQVSHLGDRGPAVIGHYDLVTKFNEGGCMFDESDPRYLNIATEALEVLAKKDMVFEINTGAMFRKYRTVPYPSLSLLRRLKELGGRVILSGDSHNVNALCHKFDDAKALAEAVGFKEIEKYPPMRR